MICRLGSQEGACCDAGIVQACDGTSVLSWSVRLQEAEVVALPRIIVKRWPGVGIDVLVNNAGLGRNDASLWEGSTGSWVEMISTNVLGVCMCTREALKVNLSLLCAARNCCNLRLLCTECWHLYWSTRT